MRKLVYILFSIFSLCVFGQEKTCLDFTTGKFEYADMAYKDWKIVRTDSEQVETNTATGLVIHNDVTWLSNCELKLTCRNVSQSAYKHAIGKVFKIIIIETSSDGYTCIMMPNDMYSSDTKFKMIKTD